MPYMEAKLHEHELTPFNQHSGNGTCTSGYNRGKENYVPWLHKRIIIVNKHIRNTCTHVQILYTVLYMYMYILYTCMYSTCTCMCTCINIIIQS